MVVEYSSAQHGGLELTPSDQYPIAITPGASARAVSAIHDAPELALPSNRPEHAPEPFMPMTREDCPVNTDDALPEKQDDKTTEATVTEDPAKRKNGLVSKKMLLIGIVVLLVVVIIGLGVGLGVSLGRKHTGIECYKSQYSDADFKRFLLTKYNNSNPIVTCINTNQPDTWLNLHLGSRVNRVCRQPAHSK
jgi:hypothetical protein